MFSMTTAVFSKHRPRQFVKWLNAFWVGGIFPEKNYDLLQKPNCDYVSNERSFTPCLWISKIFHSNFHSFKGNLLYGFGDAANCIAGKLTRACTVLSIFAVLQDIGIVIVSVNFNVIHSFYSEAQSCWQP